jgi:signal peptidase I
MSEVNPYQPMSDDDGPMSEVPLAPRWLAIVVSVIVEPLAGAGLLVLGRAKHARIWMAVGATAHLLWALQLAPWLTVVCVTARMLAWVGGIVATCILPRGEFRGSSRTWGLAISLVVGGLFISLETRHRVCEGFKIPYTSMIPTLLVGDHIYVKKWRKTPARGDVIVFRFPPDPRTDYIKRVVALPGETISIRHDEVLIDGRPIARRELELPCQFDDRSCRVAEETLDLHSYLIFRDSERHPDFGPVTVPAGHYFVMGDNRDNSNDSRVWGPLPADHIKGVASVVWYSDHHPDRIGTPIR